MDWIIAVSASMSAIATAWGISMRARYRHKSVTAVVNAWRSDSNFDLPAAIEALQGRRTPVREVHRSSARPI
jgi:hypothetical protein